LEKNKFSLKTFYLQKNILRIENFIPNDLQVKNNILIITGLYIEP